MALEQVMVEQAGEVVVAHVTGEVDLSNAESITERLVAAVPNTATALVLDMSGTDYLDSSGVRMIFELAQRLRNRGQDLALVVPEEANIRRVLTLTEVERVVPMSSAIATALEH
jgi:anti-anti-sigma factor